MDHLELIDLTSITALRIPLVTNEQYNYDNGKFFDYPFRCGITSNPDDSDIKSLNFQAYSTIDQLAPFLQSWLFFGILHEIFKRLIKSDYEWEDFVDENNAGERFITTQRLVVYIWCWAAYESAIPPEVSVYGSCTVRGLLDCAERVLNDLVHRDLHNAPPFASALCFDGDANVSSVGHRVLLSVILLCETLGQAARRIYRAQAKQNQPVFSMTAPSLLRGRLQAAGWCPWQIRRIATDATLSCSTALTLSTIDQRCFEKDHSRCSTVKCFAYDVDYDTYKSKHISIRCKCRFLPPEQSLVLKEISEILYQRRLPLLTLEENEADNNARVCVTDSSLVKSDNIPRYVAISHVWSDGLGNQEANSMPLCVLQSLQSKTDALFPDHRDGHIPFWCDTICVPKQNKVPALEAMLATYANAAVVLVLDASLEAYSTTRPPLELLLRIRISPWMQRLWTLQEGWVATNLAFQFADGHIRLQDLIQRCVVAQHPLKLGLLHLVNPSKNLGHHRKIVRSLAVDHRTYDFPKDKMQSYRDKLHKELPDFPTSADEELAGMLNTSHTFSIVFIDAAKVVYRLQNNEESDVSGSLGWVFDSLRERTTSRLEDETYCMANLLNLPVGPILAVPPEERMQELLKLMPRIPTTLAFCNHAARLTAAGFRWAPTTFMSIDATAANNSDNYGRITDGGLAVTLPGLRLLANGHRPHNTLDEVPSDLATIAMPDQGERWLYTLCMKESQDTEVSTWQDLTSQGLIVLVRSLSPTSHGRVADLTDGALVCVVSEAVDGRRVDYIAPIWMRKSPIPLDGASAKEADYVGCWIDDGRPWYIR